jgi:O-antigen/teichoic acid export membrane protein
MRGSLLNVFAWTLFGKIGQQASGFIVGALITRALGTTGRGVFAEAQTWIQMSIALFGLSLDTAIYHFANRERYPVSDGVRLAITLTLTTGASLLAGTAMVLGARIFPDKLSSAAAAEIPLMFAAVVTTLMAVNLVTLAQALGRVKLAAAISTGQGVVNLGLVLVAYAAHAVDLRLALLAVVATQLVGVVGGLIGFVRANGISFDGLTLKLVMGFIAVGLKQHVGTVASFIYTRLNILIVFHYSGAEQTGFLATAWVLAFGIFAMFGSFQLALYPRVLHNADDFTITIRSMRLSFYVGLVFVLPLIAGARLILSAYGGGAFVDAAPTFRLLLLASWVMFLSSLGAPYVIKAGTFFVSSGIAVVVGVVSIAANFLLVRKFEAVGAGAATLLSVTVGFGLALALLAMISKRSPMGVFVPDFRAEWEAVRRLLAARSFRGSES